MDYNEFEKIFRQECKKNNIPNPKNINLFYKYMKLLLEWNTKVNLTAIKNENEFIIKHFIDSLTINSLIEGKKKVIDIGSGAGFPGVPLKLFNVEQFYTLVDSVNKKVNVLNDIIEKLKLDNIEALHTRAEELAQDINYREKFDVAVSRAVSNMTTLVEYLIPFVKINGIIICMKGPNFKEELNDSNKAIDILGGKIEQIESFNINEELERNIIVIRKVRNTPKLYPRGQGKPLKEPIK